MEIYDKDPELRKKRVKYMEMVTIVETVLQRENFPDFAGALKNPDKKLGKAQFETACDTAKIPDKVRNKLWDYLKEMWIASGNEAPWLTGIG
jgi:hypothetical protein